MWAPRLTPVRHFYGVYEANEQSTFSSVWQFNRSVYKVNLVSYYNRWEESFDTHLARQAAGAGAGVLVQWLPDKLIGNIAAGKQNTYVQSFARSVKRYGQEVLVSFGPEFNGPWEAWSGRPQTYIRAWRDVVGVFRKVGVPNASFVWASASSRYASEDIAQWWPGSAYVTYVGFDTYITTGGPLYYLQSYVHILSRFTRKPIVFPEFGINQLIPSYRIREKLEEMKGILLGHSFLGYVYFDVNQAGERRGNALDWRLEGHPSTIALLHSILGS